MVKVINAQTIKEERLKKNRADRVLIFSGTAKQNLADKNPQTYGAGYIVKMTNAEYEGTAGHAKLLQEIEDLQKKINAAQAPATSDIEALLGKMFIDVTRRAQEAGDLTSFFAREITDLNADQTINLREIYKYRGEMQIISGANDPVPLIEQTLGNVETMSLAISAIGWKDSLANMLFNRVHTMEKVNQAAVDADTDRRNALTIGKIVSITFAASQKQAADATSGATFDVKMYNTIRKAIKKLRNLKDPLTGRKIAVPSINILCNSADTWDIERVVRGQLTTGGANGTLTTQNMQALPIANIVEYDQGINDGFTWGKKTMSYPGVTAGICYVYVPSEYLPVVNKRPLTLETGRGSTLELSTEERAWYRVDGIYYRDFLGTSDPDTSLAAGYGAIIECTLPSDS